MEMMQKKMLFTPDQAVWAEIKQMDKHNLQGLGWITKKNFVL